MFTISAISNYLKDLRSEKNISVRKVSDLTGISHTELINIEKGIRLNPSLTTLKKLSYGLDISFENLMDLCGYNEDITLEKTSDITQVSRNEIYYSSLLEEKLMECLSSKFKNINSIYPEFKCSSNKKLDYLIYTSDEIIAVEIKQASKFSNLSYLQIKSLFVDFYFDFKDRFYDKQLKFILAIFSDTDINVKTINKIDKEFKHLSPIFEYKVYNSKDLENIL